MANYLQLIQFKVFIKLHVYNIYFRMYLYKFIQLFDFNNKIMMIVFCGDAVCELRPALPKKKNQEISIKKKSLENSMMLIRETAAHYITLS